MAFINKIDHSLHDPDEPLSPLDKVHAQKQKAYDALPEYGSREHYSDQEVAWKEINEKIRKAFVPYLKKPLQFPIDLSEEALTRSGSGGHRVGHINERFGMNYILKGCYKTKSTIFPQFAIDTKDNTKDIVLGDKRIECKVQVPAFLCESISFPLKQKMKIMNADSILLSSIGTADQPFGSWTNGKMYLIKPKEIPEEEFVEYPTQYGTMKFGLYMGPSVDKATRWVKPVATIPADIYSAMCGMSPSQWMTADKMGEALNRTDYKDPQWDLAKFAGRQWKLYGDKVRFRG